MRRQGTVRLAGTLGGVLPTPRAPTPEERPWQTSPAPRLKAGRTGRNEQSELRSSEAKAQRTFAKTRDSAVQTYGDERRAHQRPSPR
jgi:hypothetical protein